MTDFQDIICASSLFDSCGIVFESQGEIFRALYPRGEALFELLSRDGWMEDLVKLGLVGMETTDLQIPGYGRIIRCERLRPIIPPYMWTLRMLRDAALVICQLCQETLKRGLFIWDLQQMRNMTISAQRGPVFFDLGAIHHLHELEARLFSRSPQSLLDHIAGSFYVTLWLNFGPLRRFHWIRCILDTRSLWNHHPEAYASLLRHLTLDWKLIPGLRKARRILQAHQYRAFYAWVQESLIRLPSLGRTSIQEIPGVFPRRSSTDGSPLKNGFISFLARALGPIGNRIFFDLSPESGFGLEISAQTGVPVYCLSQDPEEADSIYDLRCQKNPKVLPILCNIWDRSFSPATELREGCDVALILPNLFEVASSRRVPIDFMGRVLSSITKEIAVVGVNGSKTGQEYPGFLGPAETGESPLSFLKRTFSKYFRRQEEVLISGGSADQQSLLLLYK